MAAQELAGGEQRRLALGQRAAVQSPVQAGGVVLDPGHAVAQGPQEKFHILRGGDGLIAAEEGGAHAVGVAPLPRPGHVGVQPGGHVGEGVGAGVGHGLRLLAQHADEEDQTLAPGGGQMEVEPLPDAGAGAQEEPQLTEGRGDGVVVRRAVGQGERAALVGEHGGWGIHHEAGGGPLRHDVQMVGGEEGAAGDLTALRGVHHRAGDRLQAQSARQRRHRQAGAAGQGVAFLQGGPGLAPPGGAHGVQQLLHGRTGLPVSLVQPAVHGGVHRLGEGPLQIAEGDQGVLGRAAGGQSRRQAQGDGQQRSGGSVGFSHSVSFSAPHRWVMR